jgi:hypothetical protein
MAQQTINVGSAANDGTGDPLRTAFTKSNANFTELYAAGSGGAATPPQGRLTLQTAMPVMTTTQSGKTALFYTPYVGALVPIYTGSAFTMTAFAELSVATTDTTKSPAAVGASQVLDWFIWSDTGTLRISHGPAWTSDTVRSAGTALTMVNGVLLNNASITNGPAAQRGTYVGTTRSNASSQLDWIFGGAAAGGTAGWFGVWNCYNRVNVGAFVSDNTSTWTQNSTTPVPVNGSTTMRVNAVFGLQEDAVQARYSVNGQGGVGATQAEAGVGIDSITAYSGDVGMVQYFGPLNGGNTSLQLGFHFWQALESRSSTSTTATFWSVLYNARSGINWTGRM